MKLTQAGENLKELIRRCKNMARNLVKEVDEVKEVTDIKQEVKAEPSTDQVRVVTENQLILNSLEGIIVLCNETRKDLREMAKQVGVTFKD
jgi:Sec-independent protein translocase protein TatA